LARLQIILSQATNWQLALSQTTGLVLSPNIDSHAAAVAPTENVFLFEIKAYGWSMSNENVIQTVVDDSRRLVYILSSESSIRTFHID
jgi:hypothetical protein